MGVFSGPRERRNVGDIGNPLIPQRPDGRTTAGILVTADSAMTLSAVWACVRLRADLVSTLPLQAFRQNLGPGSGTLAITSDPTPISLPSLLLAPGGEGITPEEWLYQTQVSLDLRGNAFGIIQERDGYGFPQTIELVHPDAVLVSRDPLTGRPVYRIFGREYAREDVYHERQFTTAGNLLGLSPVSYHARSIGIGLAVEKFGADWFADGAHPSSVLSTDQKVDETQAKTIKQRFIEAIRGTREPLVLGSGVKYTAIQVSPNESQFLETMRYSSEQVGRIYGVPPEMIGGSSGASMTYANVEMRSLDFLTYGIGPTFIRRERALSRLLPARQFVRYDLKAFLRTDTENRYKTHAIGIAAKFLDPNEARHEEGLPPLTEDQKALLELVPLTISPNGTPKAVLIPGKPEEDLTKEAKGAPAITVNMSVPAPTRRTVERDANGDIIAITEA